jgi:hypothetical protein
LWGVVFQREVDFLVRDMTPRRFLFLASAGALASLSCAPRTQPRSAPASGERALELRYRISRVPSDPLALHLRLELPVSSRDTVFVLSLPDEWAGRRELHATILDLRAASPGARLDAGDGPAQRRLVVGARTTGAVEWTIRGASRGADVRGAHNYTEVAPRWAQLVGHDALLIPSIPLGSFVRASITFDDLQRGAVFATSFGVATAPRSTIVAQGMLGDIRHAVYLAGFDPGAVRLRSTRVESGTVHVAIRGALRIPDAELATAVGRVVAAERSFWRDRGPPTYLVSVGIAPRGTLAGTRLTGSFIATIDSTKTMDEAVIALFGHEMMHDWIGGAMGPDAELPEGALSWFTEGFTDFASQRVLWRTGLLSDSAYLASVNEALREQALSPARDLPWTEVFARRWSDAEVQRQPYLRGRLVALRLDAAMREVSSGRQTLDDVLRALHDVNRDDPPPLTEAVLVDAFGRVLGADRARRELDAALAGGLLQLPASIFGSCVASRVERRGRWDPSFDIDKSLASRRVDGVRPNGAAWTAGLRDGMSIVSASLWRGDASRPVEMRVRDGGEVRMIRFLPQGDAREPVQEFTAAAGCRLRE